MAKAAFKSKPAQKIQMCPRCSIHSESLTMEFQLQVLDDGTYFCQKCLRRYVRTDRISITGLNPRKHFDDQELSELQASIKEYGILENLVIRPAAADMFDLVAGERRFRSACNLQFGLVPVDVQDLDDQQVQDIMLIENIQRSQLGPMEESWAIRDRLAQGDITQAELAGKLGKTQPWLANRLRLLQAPEDLQEMIISREISPKHVILLLQYVKHHGLYKEVLKDLKEKTKQEGSISVKKLEDIIRGKIEYGNETLDLDSPSYEYRELKQYLDLSKCEKCSDIARYKKYDDAKHRFCMNKECWQQLITRAKKKMNEALSAKLAKLKKEDFVDLRKLSYGHYEKLSYANFDKTSCDDCESLKFTTDQDPICLDPKCFKKKNNAKEKQAQKKARDEAAVCWAAVDEFLDRFPARKRNSWPGTYQQLDPKIMRTMVCIFGVAIWRESARKGLSKWGKVPTSQYTDEFKAFLDNIPDEDLDKVMIRLMMAVKFTQCSGGCGSSSGANLETLREILPEAAVFYEAPEAAK